MKLRILIGMIVLVVVPVLIATFAIFRFTSEQGGSGGPPIQASTNVAQAPRPPAHAPIVGDRVTLDEARQRTPYTIPVPPLDVVGSDIQEVWASRQNKADEFKQVYIIYSNGLKISVGATPNTPPPVDLSKLPDAYRQENIGGKTATGKDAFVKTTNIGTRVNVPASLSWWDNKVLIILYHPTMSLQELVRIGEAMPSPTWPSLGS